MQKIYVGVALIILGIVMLLYTGFNFVTKEKIVDLGPVEITKEKNHFVQWPPVIGTILIVGGIVVISRSKSSI
ncbi:MAG: hypothetical protein H7296_06065 [Bacteroidia bacterium]|nr:hypothetical protein [Bacteroidia bacterium]